MFGPLVRSRDDIRTEWDNAKMDFREAMNWTSALETKKLQIELAATCNKNEQQQDDKSNAEL